MDEGGKGRVWDNPVECRYEYGGMLPYPTLHRSEYLFDLGTPSEDVTHEFYKQLYPNTIKDIDVSS